ncbi:MAG: alpha/beta hydrolase [Nanoarchaeota archaeon]|nr:alpha/beta hydrolase [Nanoarchaeota archaeon]
MKKVFIIHGWDGRPDKGWLRWLKNELLKKGFKVKSLNMPNPDIPKINSWVSHLKKIIKNPNENTFLIAHSIGCQAVIRYIESLPNNIKIGGVIFVAGWFNLQNLETDEEKTISEPWIKAPIDFNKVKPKINNAFALFSDNDPWVPISDSNIFKEKLGARIVIEKDKGHYIENITKEIPVVLNELLNMTKDNLSN